MYHSKKKMTHGGKIKKDGNALARREPMMSGGMGMKKKPMKGGGRMMYKKGGKANGMYKEDMPKAKPC